MNVLVPAEELELLLLEVCPYIAVMLLPAEVGEPWYSSFSQSYPSKQLRISRL
jgi:hypothetical protein